MRAKRNKMNYATITLKDYNTPRNPKSTLGVCINSEV